MSKHDPVTGDGRQGGRSAIELRPMGQFQKSDFRAFHVCRHLAASIPATQGYAHVGNAACRVKQGLVERLIFAMESS